MTTDRPGRGRCTESSRSGPPGGGGLQLIGGPRVVTWEAQLRAAGVHPWCDAALRRALSGDHL